MTTAEFETFLRSLEGELSRLPFSHQLAFAVSCCERAYPNYEIFSRQQCWGTPAVLTSALELAWQLSLTGGLDETKRSALEEACANATPDSDNFNPETEVAAAVITAGQEAALMVRILLQFCRDHTTSSAVRIASFARDTIDGYVQAMENLDPSDPGLEMKLDQHPLMSSELSKERADLQDLRQIRSADDLQAFRKRASSAPGSNIGLVVEQQ